MIREAPGEPAAGGGRTGRSFLSAVRAAMPAKVIALLHLDLAARVRNDGSRDELARPTTLSWHSARVERMTRPLPFGPGAFLGNPPLRSLVSVGTPEPGPGEMGRCAGQP